MEGERYDYLVQVKLKNLNRLMLEQEWLSIGEKESVCEFEYQAKNWKKSRRPTSLEKQSLILNMSIFVIALI